MTINYDAGLGGAQQVPQTAPHSSAAPPAATQGYEYAGVPGWGFLGGAPASYVEDVPQLAWPLNVPIYHKMRTDGQIDALLKSVWHPLRRLKWMVAPNGARDEVVEHVSMQMGLPILGNSDEFIIRGRKKFKHDNHLRLSLLALAYGHMMFEQEGEVDATSLKWMLQRLSPRMPQTIHKMNVARNGELVSITQLDPTNHNGAIIPVSQLVPYAWEGEGGNWAGRSMLRPLYKHWLLKDRLMRIDAMKNEKYGVGVPRGKAPVGGDPADYQRMASSIRAVENGGIGTPEGGDVYVEGIRGTLPDTIGSLRYHDEQMARSFLAMFMQLGQTDTGSRALGESFLDFFADSLWAIANWYSDITDEYVINDIVDWNYGEDEQAPILVAEEQEDRPLGPAELADLVGKGVIVVDAEVQGWIRKRFNMPDYEGGEPLPTKPATIAQDQIANVNAGGKPSKGTPADKRLKENSKKAKVTKAHQAGPEHDQASHGNRHEHEDTTPGPKTARVTRAAATQHSVFAGAPGHGHVRVLGRAQTIDKPAVGHREPTEVELSAKTDFEAIQQEWEDATNNLVDAWDDVRSSQIDALVADVKAAVENQDIIALGDLAAPILGNEELLAAMKDMATQGMKGAVSEAGEQGTKLKMVKIADLTEELTARADAVSTLMARSLSQSAAQSALLRFGTSSDPDEVANAVDEALNSLSNSYLNDQLGGALTAAQNTGRRSIMEQHDDVVIVASELLDQNTCEACAGIDGTEYDSTDAAAKDYPAGGYAECLGGARCRGTFVALYGGAA